MTFRVRKALAWVASGLSVVMLLAGLFGLWFYSQLRASRPQLDGAASLPGLAGPVKIERDALGIPTIRGASRGDVARALGYLHAQDRFFQMDTLRRRAAGELSEMVGRRALALDRAVRIHGFRSLAKTALGQLSADERALLENYTAGVNAGLAALGKKPFEYLLLRTEPAPWLPEDSLLVGYAMCLELEDNTGAFERSLMTVRDQLGATALAFFAPPMTPADAALDGSTAPLPPMPTAQQLDLRKRSAANAPSLRSTPLAQLESHDDPADYRAGSNSLALAGGRTVTGAGLLGNDMHLELRLPNTWYRASMEWPGHTLTGATLPGAPVVVVGSNGHVAWGFTASYADRTDLVVLQLRADDRTVYLQSNQLVPFETRHERIFVKGESPVEFDVQWTHWGPVIGEDAKGHLLALHWVAHDPEAANLRIAGLENATTVEEAVAVVHRAGTPSLNFLAVDQAGHAAWTLAGRLPQRFGFNGRLPVNWYFGDRGWRGLLPPDDVPAVFAAADGQLWTGNNRLVGGNAGTLVGDSGQASPARAAQLRDGLSALTKAKPADILAVELDDRALALGRWQKLLLTVLTPEAVAQKKSRAELRTLVEQWEGRASVDSVSYRLVRAFRANVSDRTFNPIFAPCLEEFPAFNWRLFNFEEPLWTLLQEKPAHLLDPRFSSWENLMLAAADDVVTQIEQQNVPLSGATWGRRNTARIQHPLASALPSFLTSWLMVPPDPLPGDNNIPRVQTPTFGASERMIVSPGHEAEGIFHMPGGQSGHPLSPFFQAGHAAWVKGEATPFLPGKTEHTLTLQP
jgi:penicillin amidase